jgi:hypothetical protein
MDIPNAKQFVMFNVRVVAAGLQKASPAVTEK